MTLEDKLMERERKLVGAKAALAATVSFGCTIGLGILTSKICEMLNVKFEDIQYPEAIIYGTAAPSIITAFYFSNKVFENNENKRIKKLRKGDLTELIPLYGLWKNYRNVKKDERLVKNLNRYERYIHNRRLINRGGYHALVTLVPSIYCLYEGIKSMFR